ncbi:MAG: four helix bundle protein [Gemmatimonadaceae bacterium]
MTLVCYDANTFGHMQDYRKLAVWTKAHTLALEIHRLAEAIPRTNNSGLINQIRRAALSIPANIAEGCGRAGSRDFAKFLQIAIGSAVELEYHLQFAGDSSQIPHSDFVARSAEVVQIRKMLYGLIRRVRSTDGDAGSLPTANNQ